jgi:hypothetical protein
MCRTFVEIRQLLVKFRLDDSGTVGVAAEALSGVLERANAAVCRAPFSLHILSDLII